MDAGRMSATTRLLWLAADPARPSRCIDFDAAGRVLADARVGAGAAAPLPSPASGRCVLAVPGFEVRVAWLELAARSVAQAAAAAPVLLAASLASAEDLHVAVAATVPLATAPDGPTAWTVAAVERQAMRRWLDRASALGLSPDAVVPEQLLLPPPESGVLHVFDAGSHRLVRGEGMAFSAEPALAEVVVGGRRCVSVDVQRLYAQARSPDLDLLQGGFAPRLRQQRAGRRRQLAWLALALLATPPLLQGAQAVRLEWAARQLEARIVAPERTDAAGTRANGPAAADPRALAAGGDAIDAAAALFAAVAAVPGARLQALEHRRDDLLRASLDHPQPQDLDALRNALARDGWRLVDGGSVAAPPGHRTAIALERLQ
jgi:general secretion pathway protein L